MNETFSPTVHLHPPHTTPLLQIKGLSKHFGGIAAVDRVDFNVLPGTIVGLIGPNGSGKTTLFNCVTGLLKCEPNSQVIFNGHDITNKPQHHIAQLGLTRTFQEVRIFAEMSVIENLYMAIQQYQEDKLFSRFVGTSEIKLYDKEAHERAQELIEFVGLSHHSQSRAAVLSFGQRKLLIFAMAVMSRPRLVLLDEPAAAINLTAIEQLKKYILELNSQGITFLIIEHNMEVIMDLCEHIIVLDHGKKIVEGSAWEIQSNDQVIDAYFGTA